MIFSKKIEDDPPVWGIYIDVNQNGFFHHSSKNADGSEEPEIICFDEKIALKIVSLWNADEADRYDKYQNKLALERQPDQ